MLKNRVLHVLYFIWTNPNMMMGNVNTVAIWDKLKDIMKFYCLSQNNNVLYDAETVNYIVQKNNVNSANSKQYSGRFILLSNYKDHYDGLYNCCCIIICDILDIYK